MSCESQIVSCKLGNLKGFSSRIECPALLLLVTIVTIVGGCKKVSDTGKEIRFKIDKEYERGPLTVHTRVDKGSISIAETIWLELEATIEPGYEVQMPKLDKALENFGIVDWQSLGTRLDANDNVVTAYRYRLEPFLSGSFEIPAFTFEFYDVNAPDKNRWRLETEPIEIEVTSLLGKDRENLQIADIEGVVEIPKGPSYWWVWLIGAVGAIGALLVWVRFRRKKLRQLVRIFKPAHEIAYARLRALVKEDLIKKGRVKEFYERVSDILRHYIEHRFELRAPERTTEEFLAELQTTDVLSEEDKLNLAEFLRHCDLVKFAKHYPTSQQVQQTFDLVKLFIEQTKSDERQIDVTDHVETKEAVEVGAE